MSGPISALFADLLQRKKPDLFGKSVVAWWRGVVVWWRENDFKLAVTDV